MPCVLRKNWAECITIYFSFSAQLKRLEEHRDSPQGLMIPRTPRQTLRGSMNAAEGQVELLRRVGSCDGTSARENARHRGVPCLVAEWSIERHCQDRSAASPL